MYMHTNNYVYCAYCIHTCMNYIIIIKLIHNLYTCMYVHVYVYKLSDNSYTLVYKLVMHILAHTLPNSGIDGPDLDQYWYTDYI